MEEDKMTEMIEFKRDDVVAFSMSLAMLAASLTDEGKTVTASLVSMVVEEFGKAAGLDK